MGQKLGNSHLFFKKIKAVTRVWDWSYAEVRHEKTDKEENQRGEQTRCTSLLSHLPLITGVLKGLTGVALGCSPKWE